MSTQEQATFRWALAGYGSGGRIFHQPLISSAAGLELVAVVTGNQERQQQVQSDLPAATPVKSIQDLPGLGVTGVTITTPSATHVPLAHQAIDLGLHVVLDKPFAMSAQDARGLVEHAERAGLVITPYQNRRWDSDVRTLEALIGEGALGRVHRFTSRIDRFRPVKGSWHGGTVADGGGALFDLGPHLIDQALHLFGPAISVHAELQTVRDGAGAEDQIELHLTHADGVHSTLAAGMAAAAEGPRFQVNGARGGYLVNGFDVQEEQLKAGGSPASLGAAWGVEPESAWGTLVDEAGSRIVPSERGRWDTYYPTVATAIAGTTPPPVDPWDAVATATVIDAARESSATNFVVSLS